MYKNGFDEEEKNLHLCRVKILLEGKMIFSLSQTLPRKQYYPYHTNDL
jgi:hypothetical protein